MYNKLFTKILDSSIWLENHPTRIVWITLLAAMDQDGFAPFSTVQNLARRAGVTDEEAEQAVATLEGPDRWKQAENDTGKRIERVPGGYLVIKAAEYGAIVRREEMRASVRERVRRHREAKSGCNACVTQSEVDQTWIRHGSEGEGETPAPVAPSSSPVSTAKDLADAWNALTSPPLPRCLSLGQARTRKALARLADHPLAWWRDAFTRLEQSRFCRGENDRAWVASFDWMMTNDENSAKVVEGKYDNRTPVVRAAPPAPRVSDEAILADLEARRALRQRRPV